MVCGWRIPAIPPQLCALPQPAELIFHDGDTTWHQRSVHLNLFQSTFGKRDTNIFTILFFVGGGGGSQFNVNDKVTVGGCIFPI